jgi:hypothetical protein
VAEEYRNDMLRIPQEYNYPPDKNRIIQWIDYSFEPSDYSWRRYKVEPQEGYNTRYPSTVPMRVRLNEEDLIITRTYDHINPNNRG